MTLLLRFSVLACLFTLFACNGEAPPVAVEKESSVLQKDKAVMPADQIEATAEANPEVVAEEQMETPEVRAETPQAKMEEEVKKQGVPARKAAPEAERPAASPASKPSSAPAAAAPVETAVAVEETPKEEPAPVLPSAPSHSTWNDLLKKFVNNSGRVDYAGLRSQESVLDAYLADLAKATPKSSWPAKERFAYWLNAYNAYTFKLILNNYPVTKITDLNGGDPWKVKWIELEGKMYSLNQIEHDIIRPRFKDPRIHFAVVCAANSCPPIANEAFTARNVNGLLDTRTRKFINDKSYNLTGDSPKISKIFDWYAEDFGDVKAYLNKYLKEPIPADATLGYKDYDWSLNKQ